MRKQGRIFGKVLLSLFLAVSTGFGTVPVIAEENNADSNSSITISFDANGGTGEMESQTFTFGDEQALRENTFVYDGYDFREWNTLPDGSGESYSDKQIVMFTDQDSDSYTLFAQWDEKTEASDEAGFDDISELPDDASADSNLLTGGAVEYNLWVGNFRVTSENAENIMSNEGEPTARYDINTNTVTLNNFSFSGYPEGDPSTGYQKAIIQYLHVGETPGELNIVLSGTNTITTSNEGYFEGILVENANLTISGDGNLTINASNEGINCDGNFENSCNELVVNAPNSALFARDIVINGKIEANTSDSNGHAITSYGEGIRFGDGYRIFDPENGSVKVIDDAGWFGIVDSQGNRAKNARIDKDTQIQHSHTLSFATIDNAVIATCSNEDGMCDLDDGSPEHLHSASLVLNAADTVYSGEPYAGVIIENNIPSLEGVSVSEVEYFKTSEKGAVDGGVKQDSAPTEVGYYYAKITIVANEKTYSAVKPFFIVEDLTTLDYRYSRYVDEDGNPFMSIYDYTVYEGDLRDVVIPRTYFGIPVKDISFQAFSGASILKSVVIPDNIEKLGGRAFDGCVNLESVTLPDSITSIPSEAFLGCKKLSDVNILESVTAIYGSAFKDCYNLESIHLPNNLSELSANVFMNDNALKNVNIPNTITVLNDSLFCCCINLDNITLPNNLVKIGKDTFASCSSLSSLRLPNTLTEIGIGAFRYCESLKEIHIPDNVNVISSSAFYNCSKLTSLVIPDGIKSIEEFTAARCTNLRDIIIPSSVLSIGDYAFHDCDSLTTLSIPSGVNLIGKNCFSRCDNLSVIKLPETVSKLDDSFVDDCERLNTIYYGGTVAEWNTLFNSRAIKKSTYLDERISNKKTVVICSDGAIGSSDLTCSGIIRQGSGWALWWNVKYTEDSTGNRSNAELEIYMDGDDPNDNWKFTVPEDSTDISPWLTVTGFAKNEFTKITVKGTSQNPLYIATEQFAGYTGIKELYLDHIYGFGSKAFEGCTSLLLVKDSGTDLVSISSYTFNNCTNLSNFIGPSNWTNLISVGDYAFANTKLSTLQLNKNITSIGEHTFDGCNELVIYCYKDSYAHTYAQNKNISFKLIDEEKTTRFVHGSPQEEYVLNGSIDDLLNRNSSTAYNPKLAYVLALMARSAYSNEQVHTNLINMGFNIPFIKNSLSFGEDYCYDYADDWSAAYSIVKRPMKDGNTLVFITIRGSFDLDWATDFKLGWGAIGYGWHEGFEFTQQEIYASLERLLDGIPTTGVKYVITGHSQGAGVGNLLAVKLSDAGVPNTNVYAYNFACPNTASGVITLFNPGGKHNNIFNIGNIEDPVTYLPGHLLHLGELVGAVWSKYGQNLWFDPVSDSPAGHDMKYYVEYLSKMNGYANFQSLDVIHNLRIALGWFCPVDAKVYNSSGEIVASVINNEANYYDSVVGDVLISVQGDEKVIVLPDNDKYRVELIGTDSGEMEYWAFKVNLADKHVTEEKIFKNVQLEHDKQMISEAGTTIDSEDVQLLVLGDDKEVVAEVTEDGTEIAKTVSVSSVTMNKTAISLMKGNSSTLTATVLPDDATDKKIIWSSSNPNIATVDGNGRVTAKSVGTATVTAKSSSDNRKMATCKVTVTEPKPAPKPATDTIDMHRMYNPNSGEHFYTGNVAERDFLISVGWNYEGVGFKAPKKSNTPMYRLYNPNAGDHHYTYNVAEKNYLVSVGWNYEGIGWYADDNKEVAQYRLYNPNATGAGSHHYTDKIGERDYLISLGWKDEGIGFYTCR